MHKNNRVYSILTMQNQNQEKLVSGDELSLKIPLHDGTADNQAELEENSNEELGKSEKQVSVQEAYGMIGGFGKFHWMASILLILGYTSG